VRGTDNEAPHYAVFSSSIINSLYHGVFQTVLRVTFWYASPFFAGTRH